MDVLASHIDASFATVRESEQLYFQCQLRIIMCGCLLLILFFHYTARTTLHITHTTQHIKHTSRTQHAHITHTTHTQHITHTTHTQHTLFLAINTTPHRSEGGACDSTRVLEEFREKLRSIRRRQSSRSETAEKN